MKGRHFAHVALSHEGGLERLGGDTVYFKWSCRGRFDAVQLSTHLQPWAAADPARIATTAEALPGGEYESG